ncbi:MAG: hypothetical protein WHS87_07685 [Anaerolineales bacterium]
MKTRTAGNGKVISLGLRHWRLELEAGSGQTYHLAQLDDYAELRRKNFRHSPPLRLGLRARVSHEAIPGTWGFGLWNDPFGFSLGFGGSPFRFPALPQAAWFFHASPENYLSFRDDLPARGFLAQVFAGHFGWNTLWAIGLFPFAPRKARRQLAHSIDEAAQHISCHVTEWHAYALTWQPHRVQFELDGRVIFSTPFAPRPPLGVVIWMDNQYAAFPPDGKMRSGLLPLPQTYWMEIILDEALDD